MGSKIELVIYAACITALMVVLALGYNSVVPAY